MLNFGEVPEAAEVGSTLHILGEGTHLKNFVKSGKMYLEKTGNVCLEKVYTLWLSNSTSRNLSGGKKQTY